MSDSPNGAGIPESVQYQPLPNIYRAFAAGASPYAVITEIIDNSIDFVRRQALDGAKHPDTLEVDIRYEPAKSDSGEESIDKEDTYTAQLIITDNAGGVSPDELSRFFQLGHTDAPPEGIGRFGVGAKRLIGIGDRIKYESHANGYEVAAGFEVNPKKLVANENNEVDSDDIYRSDVYEVEDLDEGRTRIIVEELNENIWDNLIGKQEESIQKDSTDSLWRLGETYEHFLRNGIPISGPTNATDEVIDFKINWVGPEYDVAVDIPDPVQFSWLPFDGLHPRQYKELPFANSIEIELENALRANITVALMPSSTATDAGLTVTMNNRNVLFRDTDNDLFSSRYLGNFRPAEGHGRLHCVIELHGPAENMPWSDTKDGLDGTEEVTNHLFNVTENALSEYRRQNYTKLPYWILSAYSDDEIQSFRDEVISEIPREVESINKSNSKINSPRFNNKPGTSTSGRYGRAYPERDGLIKLVRLHSQLYIRSGESVEPKSLPAYKQYFEKEYEHKSITEISSDNCPDITDYEIPLPWADDDSIPLIEDIKKLAQSHASKGQIITEETEGVPAWLLPRYQEEYEHQDTTPDTAANLDEFDLESWRAKYSTSEDIRRGMEFSESGTKERPESPEPPSGSTPEIEPTSQPQPSGRTPETNNSTSGQQTEGWDRAEPSPSRTSEDSRETRQRESVESTGEAGDDSRSGLSRFQNESSSSSSGRQDSSNLRDRIPQSSDIDSEQLDNLRNKLDLDDDASIGDVVDAVEDIQEEHQKITEQRDELIGYLAEVRKVVNFDAVFEEPPDIEALNQNSDE